jgi:hypothetical protein
MARRASIDPDIDRLYQLPPDQFVAARNALARQAGAEGAAIRRLAKPSLAAWAVNQLFWQQRAAYQELIDRAADIRATHEAAARGRSADLRGAGRAHEEAVERALKATLAILSDSGHPVTDATRQAVAITLRGLPGGEPHGRLTRQIEARGFDMFASAAGAGRVRPARTEARQPGAQRPAERATKDPDAARLAAARSAAAAAARREAEQALRRDEFEAVRAARDAERAERRVAQARDALQEAQAALHEAQSALDEAQRAAAAAARARDAAEARATRSSDQLTAARERERAARHELDPPARARRT